VATRDDALSWRGSSLTDADGDTIGTIEEIYLDADSLEPAWAVVNTGLFGTKRSFVPLHGATGPADAPSVPFAKSQVKDAPKIDPDGQLTQREEAELYGHYGMEYEVIQAADGGTRLRPADPAGEE
jgi:PRC-barrel domain protein